MTAPVDIRSDGSVVLVLGPHCIQTVAREAHRRLTDALLASDGGRPQQQEALVLLGEFLRQEDFPALRAAHSELAGGVTCQVRIFRRQDRICWERIA